MLGDGQFLAGAMMGFFLFTTASRPALGSNELPIQWVLGALPLEVKLAGREAHHSLPDLVMRLRTRGAIPPLPSTPSWRGV